MREILGEVSQLSVDFLDPLPIHNTESQVFVSRLENDVLVVPEFTQSHLLVPREVGARAEEGIKAREAIIHSTSNGGEWRERISEQDGNYPATEISRGEYQRSARRELAFGF